jgi:hypothetical protein
MAKRDGKDTLQPETKRRRPNVAKNEQSSPENPPAPRIEPPLSNWLQADQRRNILFLILFKQHIAPDLPILSDPSFVRDLWENELPLVKKARTDKSEKTRRGTRYDRWATFERNGDFILLALVRRCLWQMFGPENYRLLNVVEDHAKSNKFFARVAQHYHLDKWVKSKPATEKAWADIFEVWAACHAAERQLYDEDDPLPELRRFIAQLLHLRYGQLEIYAYKRCLELRLPYLNLPYDKREIIYGQDKLLTEILSANYNPDSGLRTVGYFAVARTTIRRRTNSGIREISVSAFAPTEAELEMRLQMETSNSEISASLIFFILC